MDSKMSLQSVQKVSRSGSSLMINIPKKIVDLLNIELGDFLKIDWGEVIKKKKDNIKKDKVELPEL